MLQDQLELGSIILIRFAGRRWESLQEIVRAEKATVIQYHESFDNRHACSHPQDIVALDHVSESETDTHSSPACVTVASLK